MITGRWEVASTVGGQSYKLHIEPDLRPQLDRIVLEFCETSQTDRDIEAMLAEHTDCPPKRLMALLITVKSELFLRDRMLDDNWLSRGRQRPLPPVVRWTTEHGRQHLATLVHHANM